MIDIDDDTRRMIDELQHVRFVPACYDKRFAHGVSNLTQLMPRQYVCLNQIYHRYRRQISNHKTICKVCAKKIPEAKRIQYIHDEKAKLDRWIKSISNYAEYCED